MKDLETRPLWAIMRDASLANNGKNMDQFALVPPAQLSPRDRSIMRGIWIAYNHTLGDPTRAYILDAVTEPARDHAFKTFRLTPDARAEQGYADFGAGNGRITGEVLTKLSQVSRVHAYLVEQSGPALNEAQLHLEPRAEGNDRLKLTFLQEDVTETSIPSDSINIVTAVNVFHHLPYEALMEVTAEMDRVLKPGGRFIIVDTHRLPDSGLRRKIVFNRIRGAVNPDKMIKKGLDQGIAYSDEEIEGIRQFTGEDAFKAFDNAMTSKEFEDMLRRSKLAPSLEQVRELRSPHWLRRHVYPVLNFATGVKK